MAFTNLAVSRAEVQVAIFGSGIVQVLFPPALLYIFSVHYYFLVIYYVNICKFILKKEKEKKNDSYSNLDFDVW